MFSSYNPFTCFMDPINNPSTSYTNCDRVITGNNLTGTPFRYRYLTDLCILCDKRCVRCYGPTNMNCT